MCRFTPQKEPLIELLLTVDLADSVGCRWTISPSTIPQFHARVIASMYLASATAAAANARCRHKLDPPEPLLKQALKNVSTAWRPTPQVMRVAMAHLWSTCSVLPPSCRPPPFQQMPYDRFLSDLPARVATEESKESYTCMKHASGYYHNEGDDDGGDDGGDGGGGDGAWGGVGAAGVAGLEDIAPPPPELLGPIDVTVAVRTSSASGGRRGREEVVSRGSAVRGQPVGKFDVPRYIAGRDCIFFNGRWMSRSHFEKVGGSRMAKWYRSIRVLPDLEPLGEWLERNGMPITKGPSRRSSRRTTTVESGDEHLGHTGLELQTGLQRPELQNLPSDEPQSSSPPPPPALAMAPVRQPPLGINNPLTDPLLDPLASVGSGGGSGGAGGNSGSSAGGGGGGAAAGLTFLQRLWNTLPRPSQQLLLQQQQQQQQPPAHEPLAAASDPSGSPNWDDTRAAEVTAPLPPPAFDPDLLAMLQSGGASTVSIAGGAGDRGDEDSEERSERVTVEGLLRFDPANVGVLETSARTHVWAASSAAAAAAEEAAEAAEAAVVAEAVEHPSLATPASRPPPPPPPPVLRMGCRGGGSKCRP
ncbi:RegA-like protein RlsB [Volvox carteri f. nagariensis]|uniref:RegA-like protein RlsB n=1 Tax=Volvox carteri f. nagariensis TaxID=3068 RepID=D8TYG0_VOLCA|nr:RegA-like protein RlsB [Volvox carteri f. nagariensis]EFJ47633.1 RegA-like protein RlsB [Volvox carteri f. nagariensis]|eukprot:XP_002951457.1 RegA-like protein RlsB [Volvox carteri f. nagariensis]